MAAQLSKGEILSRAVLHKIVPGSSPIKCSEEARSIPATAIPNFRPNLLLQWKNGRAIIGKLKERAFTLAVLEVRCPSGQAGPLQLTAGHWRVGTDGRLAWRPGREPGHAPPRSG